MASAEGVQALVQRTVAKHGRIDLMFNNAGVGYKGEFQEMAAPHTDRVVGINLGGVLHGTAAVYPIMVKQGAGHIVNTGSLLGLIPMPGSSVYAATKHAVVGFSLALREEARVFGVKVSVVCPSFIRSNIVENSDRILRGSTEAMAPPLTGTSVHARKMALAILDGVSRNRAVILWPSFLRLLWWLYRLSPTIFFRLQYSFVMRRMGRMPRAKGKGFPPARWLARLLVGRVGRE